MSNRINLRKFKSSQLMFDEDETIQILKFIFKSKRHIVDKIVVDDRVRGFAQGLLLEAIDGSYSLGFVHALFGASMSPGVSAKKVITKFGRKALKHWFQHAKAKDLKNIKIYETVRKSLAWKFDSVLNMHSNKIARNTTTHIRFITYKLDNSNNRVWG